MVQYAVPTSDAVRVDYETDTASTTNLYQSVDEGIYGGTPNDSTWVRPNNFGFPVPGVIFGLGSLDTPSTRADDTHELKIRVARNTAGSAINLQLLLIEDGNGTIKSDSFNISSTTVIETGWTLTEAQANNINDYSKLQVSLSGGQAGFDYLYTTEVEFQIPDAGGGGGSAVSDFIRFENGCMSDFRGMVDIRG